MGATLKDKRTIYTGSRISLEVHHLERDTDGRLFKREVVVHPGAVVILPMLDDDTVVLIRNERYVVGKRLVELPAGTLEKGEVPLNCAGRELQEETGYLAGKIEPLMSFYASPGVISEKLYGFIATKLQKTMTNLDDGEEIETLATPFDRAIDMIRDGEIEDAKTIGILLAYDRFIRGK
jgi:ADP-ribose pyrophosphatase